MDFNLEFCYFQPMDMRLVTRTKLTENGCLEWQGTRNKDGYGQIRLKGKGFLVHRYAWMQQKGSIPNGLCICHRCDNPSCCNLDHLFLGSQADNMRDSCDKGRHSSKKPQYFCKSKLSAEDVRMIRMLRESANSCLSIGDLYDISAGYVSNICNYRIWKQV